MVSSPNRAAAARREILAERQGGRKRVAEPVQSARDAALTSNPESPLFGRASFACRFASVEAHGSRGARGETGTLLRAVFVVVLFAPVTTVASAIDAKVERMLKQLDPDARFEQICDLEAMQ